jgi:hypothetical protein
MKPRRDAVLVRSQPCDTRQQKNSTVSQNGAYKSHKKGLPKILTKYAANEWQQV